MNKKLTWSKIGSKMNSIFSIQRGILMIEPEAFSENTGLSLPLWCLSPTNRHASTTRGEDAVRIHPHHPLLKTERTHSFVIFRYRKNTPPYKALPGNAALATC